MVSGFDRNLFSSGNRRLRKNLLQYAVVWISFQYSLNVAKYNSLNDLVLTATADSTTFRPSFAQSSVSSCGDSWTGQEFVS